MRIRTEKYQIFVSWENTVRYMKICESLIQKLMDENFGYKGKNEDYDIEGEIKYLQKCKRLLFKILEKKINEIN